MATAFRPRTFVLFVGDLLVFIMALWGSLYLRAFQPPAREVFFVHLLPFSLLFVVWIGVFFIAGLYENRSLVLARRALSTTLLTAQTFNVIIAALFFFFVPLFGIAPKTILFIYLAISVVLVLIWRAGLYPYLRYSEPAVVVGASAEVEELVQALRAAHRAPTTVAAHIDPSEQELSKRVAEEVERARVRLVIADWDDPRVAGAFPNLTSWLAAGVSFIDASTLYETVFGRVVLRNVGDRWVAQHISGTSHLLYDVLKRAMDILAALFLGALSLVLYPFLIAAIKLQDGGPVFYKTVRVGERNKHFTMRKLRTMTGSDQGSDVLQSKLTVTPIGTLLRRTRLDELPQLWNVLKGDLSLIGPRPELPALVEEYEKHIPYYRLRHLVKPGLSGWAQLYGEHAHHGLGVEETRNKLSHDLYYLTHRSLVLDATIALKTIKKLLTRSGV